MVADLNPPLFEKVAGLEKSGGFQKVAELASGGFGRSPPSPRLQEGIILVPSKVIFGIILAITHTSQIKVILGNLKLSWLLQIGARRGVNTKWKTHCVWLLGL